MFAEDISEDFSDLTFTGFYSISGYLRNLRGRLLSSEKFSEVFTLWVFTLKPFSVITGSVQGSAAEIGAGIWDKLRAEKTHDSHRRDRI